MLTLALWAAPRPGAAQDRPSPAAPAAAQGTPLDKGRPTKITDSVPVLDFERVFGGSWTFEWDIPESVLGQAGTITGTTTFTHLDGPFFQGVTEATGPSGAFTIKELIAYRAEGKTVTRWVTDSRGPSYLQMAAVGGDLGGVYNLYFDSAPFIINGKKIRVRNAIRTLSPGRFRNQLSIAIDDEPFVSLGNPWFERQGAADQ
jgi:hypothetical protein